MSHQTLGVIADIVFGALTVGLMARMVFLDKTAALSAAFIERFTIGRRSRDAGDA
jgi:hypothetical protein